MLAMTLLIIAKSFMRRLTMSKLAKKVLSFAAFAVMVTACSMKHSKEVKNEPMAAPSQGVQNSAPTIYEPEKGSHHPYTSLSRVTFSESGKDFDPNISLDGEYLYFASTMHALKPDIYRKKIFSKVVERITFDDAVDINPAISPNGKVLAFASNRNGKFQIWVKAVDTNSRTPQQLSRGDYEDRNPSWSPDNKKLVFNRRNETAGVWEVWEYNMITNEETALRVFGLYPKYSPDGKKIICQTHRNRDMPWFSIWTYTFEDEKIEEILENAQWGAVTPSFSNDGKFICFGAIAKSYGLKEDTKYNQGDDIWLIGSDGNNLIRLTNHEAPDWHPVWGTENRIFFISLRNGYQNIWMIKPKLPDDSLMQLTNEVNK